MMLIITTKVKNAETILKVDGMAMVTTKIQAMVETTVSVETKGNGSWQSDLMIVIWKVVHSSTQDSTSIPFHFPLWKLRELSHVFV